MGTRSWAAETKWGAGPEAWGETWTPGRSEPLWPRASACSGLHRPRGTGPPAGGGFPLSRLCHHSPGGWPSPDAVDCGTARPPPVGLAAGWVPAGHFWGRMDRRPSQRLCAEVLEGWPRQRGEEGAETDRWGSGAVLGSPRTVFYGSSVTNLTNPAAKAILSWLGKRQLRDGCPGARVTGWGQV